MVQVETIGEFGVLFTLFVVGLEFSPEQLHKVLLFKHSPLFITVCGTVDNDVNNRIFLIY